MDRVGVQQAHHYGHLILSTVEMLSQRGFQPVAVGILGWGTKSSLSRRILAIADYRKPSRLLAPLAAALVLLIASVGLTDANVERPAVPEKLLADRLATAELHWDRVRAAYEADTVTLDLLLASTDKLLQAELAVAKTDEARILAHKHNVLKTRAIEEKIEALYRVGARGGESEKFHAATFARQTAEIGLLRQRLGLPEPPDPER